MFNYLKTFSTSTSPIVGLAGQGLVGQKTVEKENLLGAEDLVEEGLDEPFSIERCPGSEISLNLLSSIQYNYSTISHT